MSAGQDDICAAVLYRQVVGLCWGNGQALLGVALCSKVAASVHW